MKAQKLQGRERRDIAKIFPMVALFIFLILQPLKADTIWTEGYHQINPGEVYGEVGIYNDVTLDIFGGEIYRLAAFDTTITDWYDGEMNVLWTHDASFVSIYGGNLGELAAIENSLIYLYAYDVTHTETGGYYNFGQIIGKYYFDDSEFCFDLATPTTYLHINIIPEPTTFLLFGLGVLLLRKRT